MKFGHIVTVGTSLITNTGGTGSGCQERQQALRGLERACSGLGDNVNGASIEERRRRAKTSLLGL